ncbi:MAG: transglycosylase SLT domain-containing protein [Saprospiraceae bacterium]|nr:transglycosylase SLT domain-containing protein [Saprospiraceae bacterium]
MKLNWFNWLSFFILLGGLALTVSSFLDPETGKHNEGGNGKGLPQMITSVTTNRAFSFAGEDLDMSNMDLRERLDRELIVNAYYHSSTLLSLKKTRRYFAVIEPILKEEGIPDDFKYLAVAESALMNAVSSAGARGVWQFMEATGKEYGLEINSEVDERNHLEKSTRAACRYLKSYYERFGSWQLAACGYNMGGPRLAREMEVQRAKTFADVNLNSETSRYLFRIVALKTILEDPAAFGYQLSDEDYYSPMDDVYELTVDASVVNWGDFAIKHGTNYRTLKLYNPWLKDNQLTNRSGKKYTVLIPKA